MTKLYAALAAFAVALMVGGTAIYTQFQAQPNQCDASSTAGAAIGRAGFNRKDFNVGVGFSTLFVEIGPLIGVSFDLKAIRLE